MGVIGLIVAMIVNMFLGSPAIQFAISILGVLIFAGLTAYDTQKIKTDYIAHASAMDSEWLAKSAIMGALMLYPRFHQPLHVPAAVPWQSRVTRE